MPANLPPQYYELEKKYRAARDPQEKLAYLQELLAIIPKHKGTEKIQGELKSKISKLKDAMDHARKSGGGSSAWYQVDRQGAGQVVLVGLPNSGKSSVLNALTNANACVAEYPFTTSSPQVGMMKYEDILIQIVDTPPLTDDTPAWLYSIYRSADLILIVLDATEDLETQFEIITDMLVNKNIMYSPQNSSNIKAIILVNKSDRLPANADRKDSAEKLGDLKIVDISTIRQVNIEMLKKEIFKQLDIIRVYTKKIGQTPVKREPVVLRTGTTVIQAAEHIHKDFMHKLQFTKLWNDDGYSGQRVEKGHVLKDGDIIEFHV